MQYIDCIVLFPITLVKHSSAQTFSHNSPDYFLSSSLKLKGGKTKEEGRTLAGCRV